MHRRLPPGTTADLRPLHETTLLDLPHGVTTTTTGCVDHPPDTTHGHTTQTPMDKHRTPQTETIPRRVTTTIAEGLPLRDTHLTLPPAVAALHHPAAGMTLNAPLPGITLHVPCPLDLLIILLDRIPTDPRTLGIGAALRVLHLVLVLVLTILAIKAVLVGLRTLVVPLLDIQAAMAIRATTLQGALVVLETILLVPLVITQNHPRATEDCKRRAQRMARDRRNSRLLVLSKYCLLELVQHQYLFANERQPSAMPGSLVSWLHLLLLSPTPITLYLTYLLTFDPVLHLSPLFHSTSKVSYPHSYVSLLLPPPTLNI